MNLVGPIGLLFLLAFYFLPWIIAEIRHSRHSGAIFAIDLFFGWTVLGWIAALIWAIAEKQEEIPVPDRRGE